MARWRAVVFDLDDTLYPEREFVRGGLQAAAVWAEHALEADAARAFAELWAMFEAGVRGDTFDRWLRSHGYPIPGNREAMILAYRDHRPHLKPYLDVRPALEDVHTSCALGVITEGVRHVQQAKLAALGLQDLLKDVVVLGEEEREAWKPSPRPFERWMADKEFQPDEIVYVGDNPAKDFLGARRAGWSSIRVRRPEGLHAAAEPRGVEARPDFEFPDLVQLPALVAAHARRQ
ncbi:MAG TPA: HAD-IA family hydrolase [Anaerolineales bacterium]|nr:HAD-IA family hydrolase [Anaerolineales bacterium]